MQKTKNFTPRDIEARANSVVNTSIALDNMGVTLEANDIRRLAVFSRKTPFWGDVVTKLRNVIDLYRIDPKMILAMPGVGIITLLAVDTLNRKLIAMSANTPSGVADSLSRLVETIETLTAGANPYIAKRLTDALPFIKQAKKRALQDEIKAGLETSIKTSKKGR